MPCYHPLHAWRSAKGVDFRPTKDSAKILLPCGRCIGCRLERSRQWALRLTHEQRFHEQSAFLTLTYDKEHLPVNGSLDLKHFQDFMKLLRKNLAPEKIRFFHAGEYGEKNGRPHYHAILFGTDLSKYAIDHDTNDRGDTTWTCPLVSKLWKKGLNRVGQVTFESCAYVARYITKKVTGDAAWRDSFGNYRAGAKAHYEHIHQETGEITQLKPEYATMSRRPGIGSRHFERYRSEIYPSDECVSRGHPSKPPRYYDKLLEMSDPQLYTDVKENRECALALSPSTDRTPERLATREIVQIQTMRQLSRKYEIG